MASLANVVTIARIPLAFALLVVALPDRPSSTAMSALYVAATATDVIDGPLARRAGTAGPRGARLDSIADAVFTAATIAALAWGVQLPDAAWVWWGLAAVVVARLGVIWLTFARFRVVSMMHTAANRASGVAVAVAALLGFAAGELPMWALACAGAVAFVATVDEAATVLRVERYDRDDRGRMSRLRHG